MATKYSEELAEYIELTGQRHQAKLAADRLLVDTGVLRELNHVLRGLPASKAALRLATGELATLRDALLPTKPGYARRLAYLDWLEGDTTGERHQISELLLKARDVADEESRRNKPKPERVQLPEEPPDEALPIQRYSPQTFVVTFSERVLAGQHQEWTSLCPITKDFRVDAASYAKRVERHLNKFTKYELAHGEDFVVERLANEGEWQTLRKRWNKRGQRGGDSVRYLAMPQTGGVFLVIHDNHQDTPDATPLPTAEDELRQLLFDSLMTPEGRQTSASRMFGGDFVGARGDGRRIRAKREGETTKVAGQFFASGHGGLLRAARVLDVQLSRGLRGAKELDWLDAYETLYHHQFALTPYQRDSHQATIDELLKQFFQVAEGEMSPNAHKEEQDAIVTVRRHEEQQALFLVVEEPPQVSARQPAPLYFGEGGDIW